MENKRELSQTTKKNYILTLPGKLHTQWWNIKNFSPKFEMRQECQLLVLNILLDIPTIAI